jgi:peptide/nickel transport system substrate-binding protein
MDRSQHQRLDSNRRGRSELDNHLIDEFLGEYISRRDFVRKGTVLGLGLPTLGAILAACGSTTSSTGGGALKKGGKMTVAIITPSGAIDPLKVADEGGLAVLGQAGEYLAFSDKDLKLVPALAESWQANSDGSVWTFKIRQGVKFNDGTPMTAKDVAFTVNLHADPANGSNARSVFKGVLSKGNTTAPDDTTVISPTWSAPTTTT